MAEFFTLVIMVIAVFMLGFMIGKDSR